MLKRILIGSLLVLLLGDPRIHNQGRSPMPHGPNTVQVTGLFSDMHLNPETGDIGGTEVFIVESLVNECPQFFALVQFASGRPGDPDLVRVRVLDGGRIEFDMPNPVTGRFKGRVTKDVLEGTFSGCGLAVRLRRAKSFWQ